DDHPLVDVDARSDEQRPALLEVQDRVRRRLAAPVGDERAGRACAELAEPRLEALEDVVQDPGPARLGEKLGPEADQPAGGDDDVHPDPAAPVVHKCLRTPLAQGEQLRQDAEVLLRSVDRETLDRLVQTTIDLARHDLWLAHRELESLTSHLFDENSELELASTPPPPRVGGG